MSLPRIYLDNAATSFPKPEAVYAAVDEYNRRVGVAIGRGSSRQAGAAQGIVAQCRQRAAALLGAESPDCIVFTFNGTDSLNLALHGLLRPGDHVVTSVLEHNSVLRPLRALQDAGVTVTLVPSDRQGRVDPDDFRRALQPQTRLVALMHASNVCGTIQPVEEVGKIARAAGALFLIDAAQTAGILPIDLRSLNVDLLACPGHKGLLGPLGTGLLYVRPGVEQELRSVRQGGTGTRSEDDHQPPTLPDKYESGNHNAPGLYGLAAALDYIGERGIESIRAHEQACDARLCGGLATVGGVTIFGPEEPADRIGVLSFTLEGYEPHELATILDEHFQIETRAGMHCAPGAHRALDTFEQGGTVRLSVGPFTTPAEIDAAIEAVRTIAGSL